MATFDVYGTSFASMEPEGHALTNLTASPDGSRVYSYVEGYNAESYVHGGDSADVIESWLHAGFNSTAAISGGGGSDRIKIDLTTEWSADDAGKDGAIAWIWTEGGDGDDRITARITVLGEDLDQPNIELHGDAGDDRISATIVGGSGTGFSVLLGGSGDDRLSVKGGEGNILNGGTGDDVLLGGTGADTLIGLGGDDYLRGRGGDDVFLFGSIREGERDRIVDFTFGEDKIDLSQIDARAGVSGNQGFAFGTSHGTGRAWIEQSAGSSSVLHADNGSRVLEVILQDGRDIGPDAYHSSDFIL